jgi:hypothetical protein
MAFRLLDLQINFLLLVSSTDHFIDSKLSQASTAISGPDKSLNGSSEMMEAILLIGISLVLL